MAINPRGQVPTFKDGEIIVNDSMAIMQYIEETYPDPPLLPRDKAARALAYQRFHEAALLYDAIQPLFYDKMVGQVNTDLEKVGPSNLHTMWAPRVAIVYVRAGFRCQPVTPSRSQTSPSVRSFTILYVDVMVRVINGTMLHQCIRRWLWCIALL